MTATNRANSIACALSLGNRITKAESEKIDQIRELWADLSPATQQAMLAELIRRLPVA